MNISRTLPHPSHTNTVSRPQLPVKAETCTPDTPVPSSILGTRRSVLRPTPWLDAAQELYIKSSPPGPLPESPRRPINQIGGKQSARFNRDVTNTRSCLRGREGSGYSITSDYGELWVSWVRGGWAGVGVGFEDLWFMRVSAHALSP